jgi:hypothetical protein
MTTTPDFYQYAKCRGLDPAIFVPETLQPHNTKPAKQICNTCPVQTECLNHALTRQQTENLIGIYGGTTHIERRKILTGKGQPAQPQTRTATHGTLYNYRQRKCRCTLCKAAHARTIQRQRRMRRDNSGTYLKD